MSKRWLNLYTNPSGVWDQGDPERIVKEVTTGVLGGHLGGATVRLHESARSGSVLVATDAGDSTGYGDPEVFVTVEYGDAPRQFLSAPLTSPLIVHDVRELRLSTLALVRAPGATQTHYEGAINAHLVYEILELRPGLNVWNFDALGWIGLRDINPQTQFFRPSRSGLLLAIEVALERDTAVGTDTVTMEILKGSTVLATKSLPGSSFPQATFPDPPADLDPDTTGPIFEFDAPGNAIVVEEGEFYAFRLTSDGSGFFRASVGTDHPDAFHYFDGPVQGGSVPVDLIMKVFIES